LYKKQKEKEREMDKRQKKWQEWRRKVAAVRLVIKHCRKADTIKIEWIARAWTHLATQHGLPTLVYGRALTMELEAESREQSLVRVLRMQVSMKRTILNPFDVWRQATAVVHKRGVTWVHILDEFEPGWRGSRLDFGTQLNLSRIHLGGVDVPVLHLETFEAVTEAVKEAFPLGETRIIPATILQIAKNIWELGDEETARELWGKLATLETKFPGCVWALKSWDTVGGMIHGDNAPAARLVQALLDHCIMRVAREVRYAIARIVLKRWEGTKMLQETAASQAYWHIAQVMGDEELVFAPYPRRLEEHLGDTTAPLGWEYSKELGKEGEEV
jgi:hypothetical protein